MFHEGRKPESLSFPACPSLCTEIYIYRHVYQKTESNLSPKDIGINK